MKRFKGTKNEWIPRPKERATRHSPKSRVTRIVTRKGNAICTVNATHKPSCQANAKLIAASPDLLNNLQLLIEQIEMSDYIEEEGHSLINNKSFKDCKELIEKIL